jgi:hypothetical protein
MVRHPEIPGHLQFIRNQLAALALQLLQNVAPADPSNSTGKLQDCFSKQPQNYLEFSGARTSATHLG